MAAHGRIILHNRDLEQSGASEPLYRGVLALARILRTRRGSQEFEACCFRKEPSARMHVTKHSCMHLQMLHRVPREYATPLRSTFG